MAQFQYKYMIRVRKTDIYISPNHHQDVKDIHKVNCHLCKLDALVQDVINWDETLEYIYKCTGGHTFNVMYHKLKEYKQEEITEARPIIVTQQRSSDWKASLSQEPETWESGRTEAEAIGNLHILCSDLLGEIQRESTP